MEPAVLFVGHGSRDPEGTREFLHLVDCFREHEPERIAEPSPLPSPQHRIG